MGPLIACPFEATQPFFIGFQWRAEIRKIIVRSRIRSPTAPFLPFHLAPFVEGSQAGLDGRGDPLLLGPLVPRGLGLVALLSRDTTTGHTVGAIVPGGAGLDVDHSKSEADSVALRGPL